jgi:hypothetical protein
VGGETFSRYVAGDRCHDSCIPGSKGIKSGGINKEVGIPDERILTASSYESALGECSEFLTKPLHRF